MIAVGVWRHTRILLFCWGHAIGARRGCSAQVQSKALRLFVSLAQLAGSTPAFRCRRRVPPLPLVAVAVVAVVVVLLGAVVVQVPPLRRCRLRRFRRQSSTMTSALGWQIGCAALHCQSSSFICHFQFVMYGSKSRHAKILPMTSVERTWCEHGFRPCWAHFLLSALSSTVSR